MPGDRIALITARNMPEGWYDTDTPQVAEALQKRGLHADLVGWHDDVNWEAYEVAIIRSLWDVYTQLDEFFAWLRSTGAKVRLLNPLETVVWNLDKRYFFELDKASVSTVPTTFVEPGHAPPPFPDSDFIIKPTTSAAALQTTRYRPEQTDKAEAHIASLHRQGLGAMVQPYVAAIDKDGERSLIFIDGTFDHAVRGVGTFQRDENARDTIDGPVPHPNRQPYEPNRHELELAGAALGVAPRHDDLLYARVDMVTGASGAPVIMELELFDPTLFLDFSGGAMERFADAIARRLPAA